MERDLLKDLITWKNHPIRKPLILRGARQVGKSWLIEKCFAKEFDIFIQLNFEKDKKARRIFQGDIHISDILENISLYTKKKIVPGKTLLFLDEIQECEEALLTLRYFKEELPELHVIAAGSLIDFALHNLGMPVGRIQFRYLHPLSFGEFLVACGRDDLRKHINTFKVSSVIHEKILELLKTYMWLGGMPAVVDAWLEHKDINICQEIQDEIIMTYAQDFQKYARYKQIEHVTKVFESIPTQLGNKFKFVHVDNQLRSIALKNALFLLEKVGVAHICYHSSGQKLPLGASKNEKKFKVYFFDIGLAQRLLGLNLDKWVISPLKVDILGSIAEQLVAQEFVAYNAIKSKENLYYWHREAKSSNAEVDFLFVRNGDIIPVEVKSRIRGRMKSMQYFLASHKLSPYGLKISENLFSENANIEEIPLYALEAWLKREQK